MKLVICNPTQNKSLQGIHLLSPDTWYVNDALQVAERDNFETIFLHYEYSGSRYNIPSDVLSLLVELVDQGSIALKVNDPRDAKLEYKGA